MKTAGYFTFGEKLLWGGSVLVIMVSFLLFDRENFLTLIASIVGVTSLIFAAKGNPVAQGLMIVFSLLYGYISYTFAYYGEMATYLGMTGPMAVFSLISWLRNPFEGRRSEVRVNSISGGEWIFMMILSAAVTGVFFFILRYFGTANLLPSTLSVTTSFIAVYLTFRRSPYFALAYAANDAVLILLWSLASLKDSSYISVLMCFAAFWVNDLYGFISWRKMAIRQREVCFND